MLKHYSEDIIGPTLQLTLHSHSESLNTRSLPYHWLTANIIPMYEKVVIDLYLNACICCKKDYGTYSYDL